MKKTSWEIVLAGLFCVGIAIYVVSNNTDTRTESASNPVSVSDSLRIEFDKQRIQFDLQNLEELKQLEELEKLEQLENLESLEALKGVANFLPAEIKDEFINEINAAIKDVENEQVEISVNAESGTISIDKIKEVAQGTWTAVSPGVYTYIKEFNAADIEEASLSLPYGSIKIVGQQNGEGKLSLEASGQVSTREELTQTINISDEISANRALFEVQRVNQKETENIHLQATLYVPSKTAVSLITKAGHIESSKLNGEQDYKTGGGHITLADLQGQINANTSGGHIELRKSEGTFELESRGGHIRVMDSTGEIYMTTSGGNLTGHNLEGDVKAKTNGGNIELRFSRLSGDTEATTGAGTIVLLLPPTTAADLDISGTSVDIDPVFNFSGSKSRNAANGQLGSGGGSDITAKTNYGKVIIKKNDR